MRSRNGTRRRWFASLTAVLLALALVPAAGVPSASSQEAPAYELDEFFPFGSGCCQSIAIDGDRMVIKATSTAVNVYEHDGSDWLLTDSLVRPLGTPLLGSLTPNLLDLSGDTIVAGSGGTGAHVWRHDGVEWAHQFIERPEDYTGNLTGLGRPSFGRLAVATTGDTVLVGGDRDGENNSQTGSVWVFGFEDGEWAQQDKLQAAIPHSPQHFGAAIAVDGDRLLIGAPAVDGGRAHVFEREGDGSWAEAYRLRGGANQFGFRVALQGGMAVVGDRGADDGPLVHVFDHIDIPGSAGIWAHARIPNPGDGSQFGTALAVEDDRVLVGDSFANSLLGAVYVFDRATVPAIGPLTPGWDLVQTLSHQNPDVNSRFGSSLASDGDWLAAGAAFGDRGVHVFGQNRAAPPGLIGELDDLGTGLPNVVPNELPQLHDTIIGTTDDVRELLPPFHEIVPEGSPLASEVDWTEQLNENDPLIPFAIATGGDRMVACSGMTGDTFQEIMDPWFVAYERGADGWERVQEFQMPPGSCFGFGVGDHVLDGDTLLMADLDFNTFSTVLNVYTHDGTEWAHRQTLAPSLSVAAWDLDGDVIATSHSSNGTNLEGGFNVFVRDGLGDDFVEDAAILSGVERISLGSDVSVSNGRILVGAPVDRSDLRRTLQEDTFELSDEEEFGPVFDEIRDALATATDTCREHWVSEANCEEIRGLHVFLHQQMSNPGGAWVFEKVDGTWTRQARINPDVELTGFTMGLGGTVELLNDTAAFRGGITLAPFPHFSTIEGIARNAEILLADLVFNPAEAANYAQNPALFFEDVVGVSRDVEIEENVKVGTTYIYRALPGQSEVWALEARIQQPQHGYVGVLGGGFGGTIQLGNEGNRIMIDGGGAHLLDPDSTTNPIVSERSGTFIFDRPAGLGGWIHTFRTWFDDGDARRSPVVDRDSTRVDTVFYPNGLSDPAREIHTAHPSLVPELFGDRGFVPHPCSALPGPPPGEVAPVCWLG